MKFRVKLRNATFLYFVAMLGASYYVMFSVMIKFFEQETSLINLIVQSCAIFIGVFIVFTIWVAFYSITKKLYLNCKGYSGYPLAVYATVILQGKLKLICKPMTFQTAYLDYYTPEILDSLANEDTYEETVLVLERAEIAGMVAQGMIHIISIIVAIWINYIYNLRFAELLILTVIGFVASILSWHVDDEFYKGIVTRITDFRNGDFRIYPARMAACYFSVNHNLLQQYRQELQHYKESGRFEEWMILSLQQMSLIELYSGKVDDCLDQFALQNEMLENLEEFLTIHGADKFILMLLLAYKAIILKDELGYRKIVAEFDRLGDMSDSHSIYSARGVSNGIHFEKYRMIIKNGTMEFGSTKQILPAIWIIDYQVFDEYAIKVQYLKEKIIEFCSSNN